LLHQFSGHLAALLLQLLRENHFSAKQILVGAV
jgi:hypothetical protein